MDALATVEELAEHLPFVMDPDEEREAAGALIDLSDEARHYGSSRWLDPATTPQAVINLVLRAARRHMKNYDGYIESRAGDESVRWSDKGVEFAGSAHFTPAEVLRLGELGGYRRSTFHSVGVYAHNKGKEGTAVGLVPDEGSNEPIQFFSSDDHPY